MVDNRLRIPLAGLPMGVPEGLKGECEYSNPQYYKLRSMGKRWIAEKPTIATWTEKNGVLSLPRGCTNVVREVFSRHGLEEPDWDDQRLGRLPSVQLEHDVQLWDHQEHVVDCASAVENCLVRAPTGSGKTTAAIALAARIGLPTLIVVWSGNLFDQWVERIHAETGLPKKSIGQIRGSKRKIGPITVAMQQTLYANKAYTKKISKLFACVMCDEVQRFAARTFLDVIDVFPARYRIGWSADERRKDKKEFLIYDIFGKVAADVDSDVLVKKRLVHDVEIRIVPTKFHAQWYVEQMKDDESNPDFVRLLDAMAQDKERTALVTQLARTEMALGHQVLALSHRREHALDIVRAEIQSGTQCGVMLGGPENAKDLDQAVQAMRKGTLRIAAGTYQAIGCGLDIPSVSRGIACTPIAANKQFVNQVRGRLCRIAKGKKDAALYYLWDELVFGLEPIAKLNRWNNKVRVLTRDSNWVSAEQFINDWRRR